MTKAPAILIIISIFLFVLSCSPDEQTVTKVFGEKSEQIRAAHIPDLSLAVFSAQLQKKEQWILELETTEAAVLKPLQQLADSLLGPGKYQARILQIPHPDLADSNMAIVKVGVAHLRREPRHASEMIDQSIMGNVLKLLKRNGSWYLVQTHYGYVGWVTKYSLTLTDRAGADRWQNDNRYRVSTLIEYVRREASDASLPVADVTLNASLKLIKKGRKWSFVETPDGRQGYIHSNALQLFVNNNDPADIDVKSVISVAKSMIGVPYLWGGNSTKGNDCSGFTQTVYRAHGIQLPRDARQMVLEGKEIDAADDFSNVKTGDLLFFGSKGRITHVGISLGGYDFIHQDSDVNIDSFDENTDNFNASRKRSLKKVQRIL